ncbi:MAG: hypothetical protein AB7K09_16485 [Planctomycetota bacterium]
MTDHDADARPVVIARFDDPYEFQLAKSLLIAAGIGCTSSDLFHTTLNWSLMHALDQTKLVVAAADEGEAIDVLCDSPARGRLIGAYADERRAFAMAIPAVDAAVETADDDDEKEPTGDRCPACGSRRTRCYRTIRWRVAVWWWLGGLITARLLPLPILGILTLWPVAWLGIAMLRGPLIRLRCNDCRHVFDPR